MIFIITAQVSLSFEDDRIPAASAILASPASGSQLADMLHRAGIEDDIIRRCFVLGLKINLPYHLQYLGNSDDTDFMITLSDGIGYHLFSVSSRFNYPFKKTLIKINLIVKITDTKRTKDKVIISIIQVISNMNMSKIDIYIFHSWFSQRKYF